MRLAARLFDQTGSGKTRWWPPKREYVIRITHLLYEIASYFRNFNGYTYVGLGYVLVVE